MQSEMPTCDKAVSVDTCEEAGQVLVVNERGRVTIKIVVPQELDEFKNVAFCQVVWKSRRDELIEKFGDAVEHGAEWSRKETDNGTSRPKLLLAFGQDIGVRERFAFSQAPRV